METVYLSSNKVLPRQTACRNIMQLETHCKNVGQCNKVLAVVITFKTLQKVA